MARLKRLVVAGHVHHVVQRTMAGATAFVDDADRVAFLDALARSAIEHAVAVHAYVLLERDFQLLATPQQAPGLGQLMQSLARRYVGPFNRRHGRGGTLWEGRFRTAPVEVGTHVLLCMRYIEQAPIRAGWPAPAAEYPWSSAGHHVGATSTRLLTNVPPPSSWWLLGNTPFEREAAYRRLLEEPLSPTQVASIEGTTVKGWPLGSDAFLAGLPGDAGRPLAPRPRGRPRKRPTD